MKTSVAKKIVTAVLIFAFLAITVFILLIIWVSFAFGGAEAPPAEIGALFVYMGLSISFSFLFFLSLIRLVYRDNKSSYWRALFILVGIVIALQIPGFIINRKGLLLLREARQREDELLIEKKKTLLEHIELGNPTFTLEEMSVKVSFPVTVKNSFVGMDDTLSPVLEGLFRGNWTPDNTRFPVEGCEELTSISSSAYKGGSWLNTGKEIIAPGDYRISLRFTEIEYELEEPCSDEKIRSAIENKPFYLFFMGDVYEEFSTKLSD